MRKSILIPLCIIAVVVVAILLLFASKPTPEQQPDTARQWRVSVQYAKPEALQPQAALYGKITTPHNTTLIAVSSALVKQIHAYEGEHVTKGQLIVTLDDQEEQLRLAQREADVVDINAQINSLQLQHEANLKALDVETRLVKLTETSAQRYDSLVKRQMASDVARDESHQALERQRLSLIQREQQIADYEARLQRLTAQRTRAESQLAQARLDIAELQLTAPFNGRISALNASPGQRMRMGDPVVTLYDTDRLEIRAPVPASHLPALRRAQQNPQRQALAAVATLDGQTLTAHFRHLASQAIAGQSSVDALFDLPGVHWPEPGRSVPLYVSLPVVEQVIAVPPHALYGKNRLYRVVNQRLEPIAVEQAGHRYSEQHTLILVKGAFNAGDAILTTQLPNAVSGLAVDVVNHE